MDDKKSTAKEYVGFNDQTYDNSINSDGQIGNNIRNLSDDLLSNTNEFANETHVSNKKSTGEKIGEVAKNKAHQTKENLQEFASDVSEGVKNFGKTIKDKLNEKK